MVQKLKVSFTLQPATEAQRGSTGSYTFSLTSALDGGGWLTPCSGRFTLKNDPTSIVKEAEWAPGSVWAGAENLAPITGIRFPDRPAHSESLHRLSYPGPRMIRK